VSLTNSIFPLSRSAVLNIYDAAIEALLNYEPELAIELIRETKRHLDQRVIDSPTEEDWRDMENTTDFLNFTGWEAS
jgi:phage baseplate assembly protein W